MIVEVHINDFVKVDVPLQDVMDGLVALPEEVRAATLTQQLSRIVSVLRWIPGSLIDGLTPEQRRLAARFLREQADRYDVRTEEAV